MKNILFVDYWLRYRYPLLALALVLSLGAHFASQQLYFDRSIENMFPVDSPLLAAYGKLERTFGGNEIVLAVYEDEALFEPAAEGIRRLSSIRKRLEAVDGVKAVLSIDQPLPGDLILADNELSRRTRDLFAGYTHSEDGRTVSLVCMLEPENETEFLRRNTIDQLRQVMRSLPAPLRAGQLTGEPVLLVDGFRFVEKDGQRLGRWSGVLLGLTIVICFRSLRWVLIPIAVVQLSLTFTQGLLALMQIQLSMVSSMLTAVVMVVGVATMVHVIVRFRESRDLGLSNYQSLRRTTLLLAVPVTWACTTDAVGFLSLTVSTVGPVQDFGIMMAIGSLMVLLSVFLILPGAALLGRFDADPRQPWGGDGLSAGLQQTLQFVAQRPYRCLTGGVVVAAIALWGIGYLDVETDFTRNFRSNSEIASAYNFVEERLGGAGVCDIVIPAPDRLTWDFLQQVKTLEAKLSEGSGSEAISKTFSLADAVFELSPLDLSRQPQALRNGMTQTGLAAMRGWMPVFYDAMYAQDPDSSQKYFRVMLRVKERQSSAQKQQLIDQIGDISHEQFPDSEVTGYFVLLTNLIDSVLRDQWRTFFAAVVGIGVVMCLALRDLRLALIALIPNAFPILMVLGGMGWASRLFWPELKINMGTAMIAAVSMGLSIDSSIHYMFAFQRARREGASVKASLEQVQQSVGKAMVLSTVALIVGFTVLSTSEFIPTVYFGALVSLSMCGGLAGNLIVLPAMLEVIPLKDPSVTPSMDSDC
ncbi:MAG: MMPL family transporter [Pirellulaceae bacterium]|nr:MMPL family transporter [Pirellulaceae bacterium]